MSGLNLKLDESDGVSDEEIGVSLGISGKPKPGQEDQAQGVFVKVSGNMDWERPGSWEKVKRAIKQFFGR